MSKKNYYCLVGGLPDLVLNGSREGQYSLQAKRELLPQVGRSDRQWFEWIYRPYDNKNLLDLLLNRETKFNSLGNYSKGNLLKQVKRPTNIVSYLKHFIALFHAEGLRQEPLQAENKLQELFYQEAINSKYAFVRHWFQFEMDVRNLVAAINCYQYEYDIQTHLIPDSTGSGIYQTLLKGIPNADALVWEDRPYLLQVFQVADSIGDATEKEKEIDQIKFQFLDELTVFNYFSVERLLSFIIKLQIIDRWQMLDEQAGKSLLENLIRELQESYAFTEEFSLNQ